MANKDVVRHMLTTLDNPFNPFTHFELWYEFDTSMQYNSLNLLGRIAKTSDDFTDSMNEAEGERAIEEIVRENVSGVHRRITESGLISDMDGNMETLLALSA